MFCRKRSSLKFRKFHWKTSVLESLFNKPSGLKACNFIKKRLQYRCLPLKFAKLLRTPILKNICDDCFCTVRLVTVVVTYKSVIYSWEACKDENHQLSWRSFIKRQTSDTSSGNKWQRVVQRMTTNDNKWSFWLIFFVFWIREEHSIRHHKENSLNLEEGLEEDLRNEKADLAKQGC